LGAAQPSRHVFLYDWQTLIAGALALLAGILTVAVALLTILVTRSTARRQIKAAGEQADKQIAAAREQADRMVAAANAQTRATFRQTEMTFDLEQIRNASEAASFRGMLAAAMTRVCDEAKQARQDYSPVFRQTAGASSEACAVRKSITKGAFKELRAACVRRGGDLTSDFLDLEREIDSFALQWKKRDLPLDHRNTRAEREGMHAGLDEQLTSIERKAAALREKAVERFSGAIPQSADTAATGP
jgi:vacuolar-type H+-ATPase subunit H